MSSGILNKKANLILAQLGGISLVLSGLLGLGEFKFYKYFTFIVKSLLGDIQTACGCQAPVTFSNHPYTITGLFILAVGLLTIILSFIIKSARIYIKTGGFIKKYTARKHFASAKLTQLAKQINLNGKVIEIDTAEPMVFCYGFINPRICISAAIVNSLSHQELKAVLLHEQHHLKVHEPIKLLLVKIISNALFFIPGIKSLTKQYAVFSELAADETATNNFQNKVPLAQALNKILAQKENLAIQKGLAISFFSQIIEERVNKLVDNNYTPSLKFGFVKIFSSIAVFGILALSAKFFFPSYNQFLPADNEGGNCHLTEQTKLPPNMWITTNLTNKPTPTTICSSYNNSQEYVFYKKY